MAFVFHKLRAAGPIFSGLMRKGGAPLPIWRGIGQQRGILIVNLHHSVNVSPEDIRREFALRFLAKSIPSTSRPTPPGLDFPQKFTLGYAMSDMALLLAAVVACFYKSGYWVEPIAEVPMSGSWDFSTAMDRTYASVTAKIDFGSTLATEEAVQRLSSLVRGLHQPVTSLNSRTNDLIRRMDSLAEIMEEHSKILADLKKFLDKAGGGIPKKWW